MPKTLLLADDSLTIQKVVGITFAGEDIDLVTVDNGDDALRRAREVRPDLILADVTMPGLDGYELCQAVKRDPELASTPVLLLSGTFETFDGERARAVGASGHITKPFEAQALVSRVNALLEQPPEPRPVARLPEPGPDTLARMDDDSLPRPVAPRPGAGPPPERYGDSLERPLEFASPGPDPPMEAPTPPAAPDAGPPTPRAPGPPRPLDLPPLNPPPGFEASPEVDPLGLDEPVARPAGPAPPAPQTSPSSQDPALARTALFRGPGPTPERAPQPPAPAPPVSTEPDIPWVEPLDAPPRAEGAKDLPDADMLFEEPDLPPPDAPLVPDPLEAEAALSALDPTEPPVPAADLIEPEPLPRAAPSVPPQTAGETTAPVVVDREALREALEKVAWEAFGTMSEQVVREVVRRVEAIAWESIPAVAERLVREEIARMKGAGKPPR